MAGRRVQDGQRWHSTSSEWFCLHITALQKFCRSQYDMAMLNALTRDLCHSNLVVIACKELYTCRSTLFSRNHSHKDKGAENSGHCRCLGVRVYACTNDSVKTSERSTNPGKVKSL